MSRRERKEKGSGESAGRESGTCTSIHLTTRRRKEKGTKGVLCVRNGRVLEACSESLRRSEQRRHRVGSAGRDAEPTCTSVIRPREELRGRSGSRASRRNALRRRRTFGQSLLTPTACHVADPPGELGPRFEPCLENRPGRDSCAEPWREIGDLASSTWRGVGAR